MTDRLYYTDSYLSAFDAVVVRLDRRADAVAVTLDRTAFYPTSGGQPFDLGTIDGCRVVDVIDEDEDVVHLLEEAAPDSAERLAVGQRVRGVVDWARRFDHMQQHSGQHVLSAACDRLLRARTVGFHLGAEVSTIDLDRGVSAAELAEVEDEANQVVFADRPVAVRFVTEHEAAALPLRKEPARSGTLRLVDIDDFDLSACGGTHVARTGAIGAIAVTASERFKGGQRVEFVCGGRLLARFRLLRAAVDTSVRLLSVLPHEVSAGIERLQAEAKQQRRTIAALQADLVGYRAAELRQRAETVTGARLVTTVCAGDAGFLKALASAIASEPGFGAVVVSAARPALVVVARARDVSAASDRVLADLVARFGGRGGGKPDLAQGGGLDAEPETILAHARLVFPAAS